MEFIEEDNFRDENGRLKPGHLGLKPKGATNRLQAEIKNKITEFLSGKIETIEEIYSQVGPKDKLRFLTELLAYILPKSKEITTESNQPEPRFAQADLKRLTDDDLRTLIHLQKKLYGTETGENHFSKQ
jgi:hypothetical protein